VEYLRRSRAILEDLAKTNPGFKNSLAPTYVAIGRLESAIGRTREATELFRLAVANWEEQIANGADGWGDLVIDHCMTAFGEACDALIEVRGPMEPILEARAHFERLDRQRRLKPMVRQVLVWLDIRIARALRQVGRSTEARETIRRIESELAIFRELGPPSWVGPYYLADAYAHLSTLVGRPGTEPSPAQRAEIRSHQDRAIDCLRRAVAEGYRSLDNIRRDRDLEPLSSHPDFQALLLDLAFPADPFAP
jgi:eukaryotic-like serine/threonine-protein kinase